MSGEKSFTDRRSQTYWNCLLYTSKKIIDEIAKTKDVELIDATQTVEKDLSEYDLIGFASGVYGGKFHQSVLKFASVNLTDNKNVFLICTYGGRPVFKSSEQVIAYKHDNIVGRFSCKGFDTFGPFKLMGGCLLYTSSNKNRDYI